MNPRTCYVFRSEPEGLAYGELLRYCCSEASKMTLVVRDPDVPSGVQINETLARLAEFQTSVARQREWPGTNLLADDALVYSYRVTPRLEQLLGEVTSRLFAWMHPQGPEDMTFYRADGRAILVTISHEADAYLLLSTEEFQAFATRAPPAAALALLEGSADDIVHQTRT